MKADKIVYAINISKKEKRSCWAKTNYKLRQWWWMGLLIFNYFKRFWNQTKIGRCIKEKNASQKSVWNTCSSKQQIIFKQMFHFECSSCCLLFFLHSNAILFCVSLHECMYRWIDQFELRSIYLNRKKHEFFHFRLFIYKLKWWSTGLLNFFRDVKCMTKFIKNSHQIEDGEMRKKQLT